MSEDTEEVEAEAPAEEPTAEPEAEEKESTGLTVSVSDARYPDGELMDIPGLGAVPNNSTKELEPYQVQLYTDMGFEWPEDGSLTFNRGEDGQLIEEEA